MPSVLIIEDDELLGRISADYLRVELGVDVTHCTMGAAALAELQRAIPDLVLLDLVLPDVPFEKMFEAITAEFARRGKDPRIIVISGSQEARERAKNLPGVLGFYGKPQTFQGMVEIVRIVLKLTR